MLKKIMIGVIGALVLLYPLTTWLVGFSIENRVNEAIEQMRGKIPSATVTEQHFHRGWSTSEEDVTVEMFHDALARMPGAAASPLNAFRFTLHSVIHHGPICGLTCIGLARIDSHIVFGDQLQPLISRVFGSMDPLVVRSQLGFFGGGSTTFSSPALKDTPLSGGAHLDWGGLDGATSHSRNFDSFAWHVAAPRTVYLSAEGNRFEVTAVQFDSTSKRALRSLYEGDASMTFGRLFFAGNGNGGARSVTINDLRSASQSSASDGFMTVSVKTGSGAITAAPVTLAHVRMDFTFRHLQMESLEAITEALQQAKPDPTLTPAARSAKMLALVKQPGIALLTHQPEMAIDEVSFDNAEGAALLKGLVRVRDATTADFAEGADPKALVQKLDADLDLTLDEALLQSLPGGQNGEAQLQSLAEQGLLTHENGKFHTKILYRQGQMTFNGRSFRAGAAPGSQPAPPPPVPPPARPRQ
jgi:uncharacterized protein YdgA (DUF945 family)